MPDNQEYTDEEEHQDNYLDEQREMWDESTGNYPSMRKPESLFSLFRRVWRTTDSTKVANLDPKTELGDLGISVRDTKKIAYVSKILGHPGVNRYFTQLGEITLSTSMSKKGWFVELFVTSKKFAHKGTIGSKTGSQKQGWRIFGNNQNPQTSEEPQ